MLKTLMFVCLFISQVTTFITLAEAKLKKGGVLDGGGADAVILQDDSAVLADSFARVDDSEDSEIIFSPALKQEILSMVNMMAQYKGNKKNLSDMILSEKNIFYAVKSIPDKDECRNRLSYPALDEGKMVLQAACTINRETWIREDLFGKMNLQEQALLVVHEGLRRNNLSDSNITAITNGLRITFKYLKMQMESNHTKMSENEKNELKNFVKATLLASWNYENDKRSLLDYVNSFQVSDHGGWMKKSAVTEKKINPSTVIGIGAIVGERTSIDENSTLIMTNLCEFSVCNIGKKVMVLRTKASVSHMWATHIDVGNESSIIDSTVRVILTLNVADQASIRNSSLYAHNIKLGKNARVINIMSEDIMTDFYVAGNVNISDFTILEVIPFEYSLLFKADIEGNGFVCNKTGSTFIFSRSTHSFHSLNDLKDVCYK